MRAHLAAVGLPIDPPLVNGQPMDAERLLGHMASDKKVADGKVTFVLAKGIGKAFLCNDVDPAMVLQTLRRAVAASH